MAEVKALTKLPMLEKNISWPNLEPTLMANLLDKTMYSKINEHSVPFYFQTSSRIST